MIAYLYCLPKRLFNVPYSTVVNDREGELLGARIAGDNQWRFPHIDTIPGKFKACLVHFEDRHFYRHQGVNLLSLSRAFYQNIKTGRVVSGGSTITMQTIRLSRNKPRTLGEKVIEIILATRLELRSSKEEILNLYVSHAPFGGNVVGLEAAAWRYFGHSSSRLSWAESATLAVLPNAPSMIHLSRNREQLLKKRNRLLKRLYEDRILDEGTYELALEEHLPDEPYPLPRLASHLVDYYYKTVPGYSLSTTIDVSLQQRVEQVAERWYYDFARSNIKNLAVIVTDVRTNEVLAYCGNVPNIPYTEGIHVDIIRAPRSSGSILKPFLYCAMLQEGELLPDMLVPDIPLNVNGFIPQNFNRNYDGAVPASEALARSLNIPAVQELRKYSVPKFYDFLKNAGVSTLDRHSSHYGLSLILGGAEVSLLDMVYGYTAMARRLQNLETYDRLFFEKDQKNTGEIKEIPSIYDPGAVWYTFEALKEVNRPEEIDWKYIPSMQEIAWKTGTSYGFRDAWAVGVTPRYAVGVWVGNASGEGKPELTGARTAGPLLFDVFNLLPSSTWFTMPYHTFIESDICMESGFLKGIHCGNSETILICPAGMKTETCPYHVSVYVTEDETYQVYKDCAGLDGIKNKSWFVLPPVWAQYYKKQHPEYRNLPPFKPGCAGLGRHSMMEFIYPSSHARLTLPRQMDGSEGTVVFDLAHANPDAIVYWHLDNEYIGSTVYFHQMPLQPLPGTHSVTVVDNEANTLSVRFYID